MILTTTHLLRMAVSPTQRRTRCLAKVTIVRKMRLKSYLFIWPWYRLPYWINSWMMFIKKNDASINMALPFVSKSWMMMTWLKMTYLVEVGRVDDDDDDSLEVAMDGDEATERWCPPPPVFLLPFPPLFAPAAAGDAMAAGWWPWARPPRPPCLFWGRGGGR